MINTWFHVTLLVMWVESNSKPSGAPQRCCTWCWLISHKCHVTGLGAPLVLLCAGPQQAMLDLLRWDHGAGKVSEKQ